jgi:hypothetical protein
MTVQPKKAKTYSGRAGRPIMSVMLGQRRTVISMHCGNEKIEEEQFTKSKFKPHTTSVMKIEVVSPTLVTLTDTKMQVTYSDPLRNKKRL